MADTKKKAFVKGHNVLKGKPNKPISKVKEVEKRKAEELETAAVLNEYIQDFTTGSAGGKAFVRAGMINPEKSANPDMVSGAGKLYKPKSKMQELAEEFKKSKAISDDYRREKEDNLKKKATEKKKSNLELFKEELQQSQKERDIRHKLKKGDMSGITDEMLQALPPTFFNAQDDFRPPAGSHDNGDPQTTNLFVSNLNPKMNEEMLCKVFGKYGPLASVKVMWPRTEEEKSRNRNCGFVAFMTRKDGEKALDDIEGKDVMEYEMKIGWGKAVPIPPTPIYIHPTQKTVRRPPKQSGHPFNCQIPYKQRKAGIPFDYNLENTIVKVVIPQERALLSVINRMVEFVVREGPMFEAMIMNREISNPMFRFLFDNKSNEHTYYRWRVFSILQGDTPSKWEQDCFRMFAGGSIWEPPSMHPYGQPNLNMGASALNSAVIASISTANAHNEHKQSLPVEEIPSLMSQAISIPDVVEEKEEKAEKRSLNDKQRDKLEDLLRTVTTDRYKVGELMTWCIDHADCSGEIIECICESLSILETPIPTKIARMFVVSDILHNSAAKVPYASHYRTGFQDNLMEVSDNLHKALASCSTKLQAEKFRKQVLSCLAAWQDWAIYPPAFLINLQNVFVGISEAKSVKDPLVLTNDEAIPFSKDETEDVDEDLDGDPLLDPDLDGMPLAKDELDGEPLDNEADVLFPSRWTNPKNGADDDDPLSKSRWEKGGDDEEKGKGPLDSSKWAKVGEKKKDEQDDEKLKQAQQEADLKKKSSYQAATPVHDESRRKFLREVEVKVMRFVDKLEQRGGTRSGLNIQAEAEKFRQQLIDEYDMARQREARRKTKSDRKRDRSSSPSDVPKKKKASKRGRSSSSSSSSSDSESGSSKRKSRSKKRHGSGTPRHPSSKSKDRYRSTSPAKRSSRRSSQSPYSRSPRRYTRSPPSRRSSGSPSPNRRSSSRRNSKSPVRSSRSPRRSSRSPYRRSSFSPRRDSRSPTPRSVGSPFGTPKTRGRSPYMDISPNDRGSLSPQRSPRKRSAKNSPATRSYDSPARSSKKKKSKKSKR